MWEEDDYDTSAEPKLESFNTQGDTRYYTMNHGTSREAANRILETGFRPSSGSMLGPGVSLTQDPRKACRYPVDLPVNERVVLRVKVDIGKVIAITYQGHPLQKTWHDHGYEAAWCPPNCGMVKSGLEEHCVWDAKRVKKIEVFSPKSWPNGLWAEDDYDTSAEAKLESFNTQGDTRYYTMYHGTSKEAADSILETGFRPSSCSMLGPGVSLTQDLRKACRYPLDLPDNERVVLRVKVDIGKVIAITYQGHPLQKTWHDHGYDAAWCPPNCGMVKSGLEEHCVWDAK
ncbi:uncharacterized protein LOC143121815 [Alosa pseudoharengus]|uniref:uncharacterized protein LOC143121815 n=1 Tax=Alosa pseudoharengus TaxID=34774 RepID=UPI003F8C0577